MTIGSGGFRSVLLFKLQHLSRFSRNFLTKKHTKRIMWKIGEPLYLNRILSWQKKTPNKKIRFELLLSESVSELNQTSKLENVSSRRASPENGVCWIFLWWAIAPTGRKSSLHKPIYICLDIDTYIYTYLYIPQCDHPYEVLPSSPKQASTPVQPVNLHKA